MQASLKPKWVTCKWLSFEQAFKGMKGVLMSTVFSYHDGKGRNPLWRGIQYKGEPFMRPAMLSYALTNRDTADKHTRHSLLQVQILSGQRNWSKAEQPRRIS